MQLDVTRKNTFKQTGDRYRIQEIELSSSPQFQLEMMSQVEENIILGKLLKILKPEWSGDLGGIPLQSSPFGVTTRWGWSP